MKLQEGFQDIEAGVGIEVSDFPEDVFRELLGKDPEDSDTRSQVVGIRLPNGDLVLGFYPQGETYEYVTQHWGV